MGSLCIGRFVSYIRSNFNQRLAKLEASVFGSDSRNCKGFLLLGNPAPKDYVLHRFGVFFQVASMFQDPSIGEIKVYYVVTKIIVLSSTAELVRIDNCINILTSLD